MFARVKLSLALLSVLFAAAWAAEPRWVTFKTGHDAGRMVEHQIDRRTIRQEGPYRIFWTRIRLVADKEPFALSVNEAIVFWSQKYAVDCKARRFSGDIIGSNNPHDAKKIKTAATAKWVPLTLTMEKAVCAK